MQKTMRSALFHVNINRTTGGISRIAHPSDQHAMNWVCNPDDTPWQPIGNGWGLGWATVNWPGDKIHRWQQPISCEVGKSLSRCAYQLPMLRVTATRRLTARGRLEESFEFANTTGKALEVWGLALATPWNDNYPDARTCLTRRCNAHLWCGGSSTYACAIRMSGEGPHLGLVLTEGGIKGYGILDRGYLLGGSNTRGSIMLIHGGFRLGPGEVRRVAWRLFWHTGWDDFLDKARGTPGFIHVSAAENTMVLGRSTRILAAGRADVRPIRLRLGENGKTIKPSKPALREKAESFVARPDRLGDNTVHVEYGNGRKTWLRILTVPPVAELIRARVRFIVDKQQVRDSASPINGALICYDNAAETTFYSPAGPNAGQERVGMGVLLAAWARRRPTPRLTRALRIYHDFVRRHL